MTATVAVPVGRPFWEAGEFSSVDDRLLPTGDMSSLAPNAAWKRRVEVVFHVRVGWWKPTLTGC
jgi:hypothetical protein